MFKGLEHRICQDSLREMDFFSPGKERLTLILIAIFSYLTESRDYRKDGCPPNVPLGLMSDVSLPQPLLISLGPSCFAGVCLIATISFTWALHPHSLFLGAVKLTSTYSALSLLVLIYLAVFLLGLWTYLIGSFVSSPISSCVSWVGIWLKLWVAFLCPLLILLHFLDGPVPHYIGLSDAIYGSQHCH